MFHFIGYLIVGLVVGLLARFFHPGPDHIGLLLTIVVGIAGSFVGGFLGHLFKRPTPGAPVHPPGLILSVIGAVIVLVILNHF